MSSTKSGKSACRRVFRSQAKLYWRRERKVGGVRGSAAGAGFSAAAPDSGDGGRGKARLRRFLGAEQVAPPVAWERRGGVS